MILKWLKKDKLVLTLGFPFTAFLTRESCRDLHLESGRMGVCNVQGFGSACDSGYPTDVKKAGGLHQPRPYSPAQGMQTNFPYRTQARCSATISPQMAHGTDVNIFARTGISGFTSLIRNNSSIGILRIFSITAACRLWNSVCSVGVAVPPITFSRSAAATGSTR
jgi:hypothetical protein